MASKLLACAVFFSAFGTVSAGGDSLFTRVDHDFGSIPRGPTQTTTFEVTNKSKTTVHFYGVRIPCSCIRASVSKNELKPGESTTVVVNLDTRRVSGVLTKYAFVQSDRPGQEEVRLTFKANVRDDLVVAPETLAFGRVKHGSPKDATVTVLLSGNAAAKILKAKSDSDFVQAKVRELPRESNGVSYEVSARLNPGLSEGTWYSTIWLTTDNPSLPRFPITVTVQVQGKKDKTQ
jgi:hypothetical protein